MTSGFSPSSHYELYEPIGPITGCDCGTASKHQPRHTRTMDCYVITCSHIHWIEDASSPQANWVKIQCVKNGLRWPICVVRNCVITLDFLGFFFGCYGNMQMLHFIHNYTNTYCAYGSLHPVMINYIISGIISTLAYLVQSSSNA